jgi:N-acetylneuraminic acid mutarotase
LTAPPRFPTLKTYRYDPVGNVWNDAAIADLRSLAGAQRALSITAAACLAGGYVNGALHGKYLY